MSTERKHSQQYVTHTTEAEGLVNSGKIVGEAGKIEADRVWHLYVLQCADGSFYCGIALDVKRRFAQHQNGRGAKYTRARLPVTLLTSSAVGPSVAEALKAERRFKALPRAKKLKLVKASTPQVV